MNISATTQNTASYVASARIEVAETAAAQDSQNTEMQSNASNNYDSVSISKEGLAELKSLLNAARTPNNGSAQSSGSFYIKTIENRALSIVMSKALSVYTAKA